MRRLGRDEKTSAEAVAYTHDCTPDLNSSTISTATWVVTPVTSPAIVTDTVSNTTTTASIRLSAGLPGTVYTATLTIVTAASETLQAAHEVLVVG